MWRCIKGSVAVNTSPFGVDERTREVLLVANADNAFRLKLEAPSFDSILPLLQQDKCKTNQK